MKTKITISILLVLCMGTLLFAGCDAGANTVTPANEQASAPAATEAPAPVPSAGTSANAATLNAADSTLTVNATESVKKKPDIAYINLGVVTKGNSAEDAQQKNATQATALLEALKQQGIEEKDIETSYVNLYQDYENPNQYVMENTYRVTVRNIDNVGQIIDAAIQAGANQSYSLSFDIQDRDAAYLEALGNAMQSIGTKAQAVAQSGGFTIVRPQSIQEGGSSGFNGAMPMAEPAAMESGLADGAATPVTPGDIEVSASVTGTYVIN